MSSSAAMARSTMSNGMLGRPLSGPRRDGGPRMRAPPARPAPRGVRRVADAHAPPPPHGAGPSSRPRDSAGRRPALPSRGVASPPAPGAAPPAPAPGPARLGDDEAATDADDGVRRGDLGDLSRPQAALVDLEGELAALEVRARAHRIVDDRHDRAFPDGHGDAAAHEDADDGLLGGLDAVTHEYVVADLRGRALGVPRVGDRPLAGDRGDGPAGPGRGGGERRGAGD